ncbi:polyprenol phosphomannose-dependent alpha 1,6 mannosyltransferase MptB [Streptomyces sp. NPDC127084]|uniref:polyprenol phosphomannose-dependent alpha 1,6 mannosyltransferase MptB n=1 Tax=Streptomyces sp. NPDC127084 TaxID=3347133 RepID=UPI00365C480D
MWMRTAAGARRLGVAGSLAMAVGGLGAGSLPAYDPWGLWQQRGSLTAVALVCALLAYAGLTLLLVAWWADWRRAAEERPSGGDRVRETLVTLACWTAPLLLAPPLYSADVYSYIAQGAMVLEGHDVYARGPSVLGPDSLGADAAASVGGNWTDTPAPYGPVFLLLAKCVVWVTGGAVVPAVFGMRLAAVAALALIVWSVRRLAVECGADESRALWLAALNPLLLMHVVGGMHNDGLMIGLMLAGIVCALRGRWLLGSAVVGLAMMVKSPAAIALLFIAVIVVRGGRGTAVTRVAKAVLGPVAVAALVAVGTTLLAGTGFGWLRTQSVAASVHTPLSLTSDIGLAIGHLARLAAGTDPMAVKSATQALGLAAALAVIACLAVRSLRGRLHPVPGLGLSLLVLVALSPMVQPWYLLWGTAAVAASGLAAAGSGARLIGVLVVLSTALVYETQPSGHTPAYGFVLGALAAVLAVAALRRRGAGSRASVAAGKPVPPLALPLPRPRAGQDQPTDSQVMAWRAPSQFKD